MTHSQQDKNMKPPLTQIANNRGGIILEALDQPGNAENVSRKL